MTRWDHVWYARTYSGMAIHIHRNASVRYFFSRAVISVFACSLSRRLHEQHTWHWSFLHPGTRPKDAVLPCMLFQRVINGIWHAACVRHTPSASVEIYRAPAAAGQNYRPLLGPQRLLRQTAQALSTTRLEAERLATPARHVCLGASREGGVERG